MYYECFVLSGNLNDATSFLKVGDISSYLTCFCPQINLSLNVPLEVYLSILPATSDYLLHLAFIVKRCRSVTFLSSIKTKLKPELQFLNIYYVMLLIRGAYVKQKNMYK